MASKTRIVSVMKTTDCVVVLPTPSAPPVVLRPMWMAITGIAPPNTNALRRE